MLRGIDISAYQTVTSVNSGPDFVICKATEGTSYVSSLCDQQYQAAKKAGKLLGVYHYAHGTSATAEATFFVNNIKGYVGEAILCLDWEAGSNSVFGTGEAAEGAWVSAFANQVHALTQVWPLVYVQGSADQRVDDAVYQHCGLWLAQWLSGSPSFETAIANGIPRLDSKWSAATLWQFTDNVGGLKLDGDLFNGDAAAWRRLAGKDGTYTPPAPTPSPAPAPAPSPTTLTVDGLLGPATIKRWQQVMGTTADGVISSPSALVKAVQTRLNAAGARDWDGKTLVVDGLGITSNVNGATPKTRTQWALEAFLGTTRDGILSKPSACIKALQTQLNAGHFNPVAGLTPTPAPAPAQLTVDGLLGSATIKRWQQVMGTTADGVISKPSALVKAVQTRLNSLGCRDWDGKALVVDGIGIYSNLSAATAKSRTQWALQVHLGTSRDGILSKPSACVKALQTKLNANTF